MKSIIKQVVLPVVLSALMASVQGYEEDIDLERMEVYGGSEFH